jgi:hypothetical protein
LSSAPQSVQKASPTALDLPQAGQVTPPVVGTGGVETCGVVVGVVCPPATLDKSAPQSSQNAAPSTFSVPHAGHFIISLPPLC